MTNLLQFKRETEQLFQKNNIDKDEVNILFCEALNISLSQLLLKETITAKELQKLSKKIDLRLSGMPITKIFKKAYFYGDEFYINSNVLSPRPETEILVEKCLQYLNSTRTKLDCLDLCTGSGAIAIEIKKNANVNMVASDISKKALDVARKNAKKLNVDVKFVKSNMFEQISQKFDVIVSNPPYIPTKVCRTLDVEVRDFDPMIALDGGEDGLDFYKQICKQSKDYLNKNGAIFLEVGIDEAKQVKNMFEQNGFACEIVKDYNNIDRIVVAKRN